MSDDKIIKKLIEHDEKLEALEDKMEAGFKDTIGKLEKITTIVQRLDQERVFTNEWIKRVEGQLEKQEKEITKIKQILKIA